MTPDIQATAEGLSEWRPISEAPCQTEVLVCNDCLLGWWEVAIQNAFGDWEKANQWHPPRTLKYEPTHWQELPSIYPISLRGKKQ